MKNKLKNVCFLKNKIIFCFKMKEIVMKKNFKTILLANKVITNYKFIIKKIKEKYFSRKSI